MGETQPDRQPRGLLMPLQLLMPVIIVYVSPHPHSPPNWHNNTMAYHASFQLPDHRHQQADILGQGAASPLSPWLHEVASRIISCARLHLDSASIDERHCHVVKWTIPVLFYILKVEKKIGSYKNVLMYLSKTICS